MNRPHHVAPNRSPLWIACVVILVGAALRALRLGEAAIWWDEGWSFWNARQPLGELTRLVAHDSHPPLYQWALHGWMQAAGISEVALRWLSVLAGVLTVAAAWALGRRLGQTWRAGALAGLLVAISAFHGEWSQQIRMYAFPALFATLAAYAALRVRAGGGPRGEASVGWWGLLALAGAAAMLSHYLGGFMLVILNAHWLLTWRTLPRRTLHRRAFHRRWIAAMSAAALLIGAWLAYALPRIRGGGGEAEVSLIALFRLLATLLAVGKSTDLSAYGGVTLLVMAAFTLGWLRWARRDGDGAALILLAVLLPPVAVWLLARPWTDLFAPPPSARYFVIFVPLILAGAGSGLDALLRWRRRVGAILLLAVVAITGWAAADRLTGRHYQDDYASLVAAAVLLPEPGEPVYLLSGDRYPAVDYYVQRARSGATSANAPRGLIAPESGLDPYAAQQFAGVDRFWLLAVEAHLVDPAGALRDWIETHYRRIYATHAGHNALILYSREASARAPDPPAILPPADRDLRPGDRARIGVPGGTPVTLSLGDQVIAAQTPDQWALVEFPIYDAYPAGNYVLRAGAAAYRLRVTGTQPRLDPPPDNLNVTIGPFRLIGYWLWGLPVAPGESFTVSLYWQVETPPEPGLTAFVHLLGPPHPADGGPVWDTADGLLAGTPSEALWVGHIIADRRSIQVPESMPEGWTSLEIGLYRLATLERLPVDSGGDRVLIPGIEVRRCVRVLGQCLW